VGLVKRATVAHNGPVRTPSDREPDDRPERGGFIFAACADVESQVFNRFYHEVLEPAFAPEELNDLETLRTEYLRPLPGFDGEIALQDGEPVGGALGEHYAASGVMMLGYLAVRADVRGRGVGSALLDDLQPKWRKSFRPTAILAEIEDPRYHKAGPRGDPLARIRFYDRIGAKLLPLRYFQPSLGCGLARVRGMFLICLDPGLEVVPTAPLLTFLDEYFAFYEGAKTKQTDPEYLALCNQVGAWSAEIPLWPLSRANEVPQSDFGGASSHA
jgi:GNAT superfamily N-acetyltransferase